MPKLQRELRGESSADEVAGPHRGGGGPVGVPIAGLQALRMVVFWE